MEYPGLVQHLHNTSHRLSQLIEGIADAELRWKPSELEFSALENLCHLRDLEVQGYGPRINRILEEPDPALPDFDGARVAAESDYNSEDPDLALRAFEIARRENLQKLSGLIEEQLNREGTLEGVGRITLKRLTEMMLEHDEGHLEELRVLRQRVMRLRD